MSKIVGLNRRAFIKSAGMTALAASTVGAGAEEAAAASPSGMKGGKYDFDTPYDRVGSNCARWDTPGRRYESGKFKYGMGVATMDFEAAPCITEALAERCKHHNWGYMSSTDSLREAIVTWNGERHDVEIDPESLVISAGVYPGIIGALRTFAPPASKVLLLSPIYDGFYYHCRHTRVVANDSPMIYRNGRYEVDWADLESRMTPDTQAMILCNPQNPTGNVWSEDDLLRIGRMCLEKQIVVLSDEIHSDMIRGGHGYVPFARLPDKAVVKNSVTFNAISKTFNLAGMKNAYFHSTNPVFLERIKLNHRGDLSTLGVVANEAAYREGADWIDQLLPYLDDNHTFVENYVVENMPLVGYKKAQGTYLTWLDFSRVLDAVGAVEMAAMNNKASPEHYMNDKASPEHYLQDWLVEHSGVYLNPGSNYGTGGAGHMRMNLGSSRIVIKEALDSMAAALRTV